MNIDIPADLLNMLNLITIKSGETPEEALNSAVRFFIMIHFMPFDDQVTLKSIIQKTYPETELIGFH